MMGAMLSHAERTNNLWATRGMLGIAWEDMGK